MVFLLCFVEGELSNCRWEVVNPTKAWLIAAIQGNLMQLLTNSQQFYYYYYNRHLKFYFFKKKKDSTVQ